MTRHTTTLKKSIIRSSFRFDLLILVVVISISFGFISDYLPFMMDEMIEICDNALDDDDDGLIDLNDPDCACPVIEPKSLIPNPSFEDRNCCPGGRAELHCADVWIQASAPTTDYIHTCGWMGPQDYSPPTPFPDGIGIVGFRDGRVGRDGDEPNENWKEYAGACLLNPLEKNTSYRFEFELGFLDFQKSPPLNVTFFGTTDCINLPFGGSDDRFGCPTNGPNWIKLGSQRLSGGGGKRWVKGAIEITPRETITAIAIGPDCPAVPSQVNIYYYFDNLILADTRSFEFQISELGHPCAEDFKMQVPDEEGLSYQWYKGGVALINETRAILSRSHGDGTYQVRILGSSSCLVTKTFTYTKPVITTTEKVVICENEIYPFGPFNLDESGNYEHTFKTVDNCDSVVTLDLTILGMLADTVQVKIFKGEIFQLENYNFRDKGAHVANIPSSIGCDSLVLVNLNYYHVYFPNVFSPNNDGQNDNFNVFGNSDLVEIKRLTVFDRWGKQIFDGADLYNNDSKGWRGTHHGQNVESGIYSYITTLLMDDGKERQFSGTVLVVQ